MEESELIFNFFFILLCFCIIYPPKEFISLGLTIESCFSKYLGPEDIEFIQYHQKRTCLNLVVHSSLPALYFLIHNLRFEEFDKDDGVSENFLWDVLFTWETGQRLCNIGLLFVIAMVVQWQQNNWEKHPISRALMKFSNAPGRHAAVASDINNEYRRQDVLKIKINSISAVVATENWIIKTTPYAMYFAHQNDTTLRVDKSETYGIGVEGTSDALQIISINVKSGRSDVPDFKIRINALEYLTLEERVSRPIIIPSDVEFHRHILDRFVSVFKDQVAQNPVHEVEQVNEKCFACMIAEPNIIITKHCSDQSPNGNMLPEQDRCTNCYCRPMWCVECLAKWFAARQSEFDRFVWLEKKCTCPTCRAKFCLLDVGYIRKRET